MLKIHQLNYKNFLAYFVQIPETVRLLKFGPKVIANRNISDGAIKSKLKN